MALHICPSCGNQRSRRKDAQCTICFFLEDLLIDHANGLHADKFNVSCKACRPEQLAHLEHIGSGRLHRTRDEL
jgi:NMD protein affecting ribosome stability and mRNA decay